MLALPSISNTNAGTELSPQQQQNGSEVDVSGKKEKRSGIRVVGNRIYDSANGKTCHQCRQKTRDFAAACKNLKNGKPCVIKLCHKCLLNRYGEKAEEVDMVSDWKCPKCRGICNCSCCMKRRGQQPTGALVHVAKASGFKSVSDMLAKASENLEPTKEATLEKQQSIDNSVHDKVLMNKAASPLKSIVPDKEFWKENTLDGNSSLKLESLKVQKTSPQKSKKTKRERLKEISNSNSVDDACQIKSLKMPKICNEVLEDETKGNANDGIKVCNEVSEKETKVDRNRDIVYANMDGPETWAANDFCLIPILRDENRCKSIIVIDDDDGDDDNAEVKSQTAITVFHGVSEKEREVDRNHAAVHGNGPEAWCANDFFFDPKTLNSNDFVVNPNQQVQKKIWNNTVVIGDNDNAGVKSQMGIAKFQQLRKFIVNSEREKEKVQEEIPLPPGTELTDILDIEFPPEDVGNALQFLEFCRVFGKALDVKKGEAEAILRELIRKQNLRRGQNNLVIQFQIRVLTLILIDSGEKSPSLSTSNGKNSWLKALEDLITESDLVLKEFPLDWLKEGISGYYDLDLSKKLTLLNFLCDEALGTEKLRSYIDDQNLRFAEEMKEAKSKVAAAKEKERGVKKKLQDEVAKAFVSNGAPLSISEHDALVSKIKSEAAQAHAEVLEAQGTIPKRKQSSDATRTEPEFLDCNGQAFWKLQSYNGEYAVLLQDIKIQDAAATKVDERWFVYGPEKKEEIDKYITSRSKRPKSHKVSYILSNESSEADI
ncbi:uncharacterized protein LOC133307807 [Gastrolobium bilobum]|uniref:uncharacterized protein LOC133307807 n=1 Tax=Gastrolobium bilobum TaxID=150636 RepID=UPI002AB0A3C4|nr:uncharacterized protein LOC133307807 [Gastrolobium bilobum]